MPVSLDNLPRSDVRQPLPDELGPYAHATPQGFYETGKHAGNLPAGSTKVGFSLRNSRGKVLHAFSFLINPQGIGRVLGGRATLAATKGAFYVQDFGPAPGSIVLRQLIGEGLYLPHLKYTGREDFQRFLKTIYLPATQAGNTYRVFFHDHHFERGHEERVFFPPGSLNLERSVDLHGLWRCELQMISLEKYPYGQVHVDKVPRKPAAARKYRVKRGDTLEKIVRRLAGKHASKKRRKLMLARLLALNPFIKKRRTLHNGHIGKPMKVYPGEILKLPQ